MSDFDNWQPKHLVSFPVSGPIPGGRSIVLDQNSIDFLVFALSTLFDEATHAYFRMVETDTDSHTRRCTSFLVEQLAATLNLIEDQICADQN